MRGDSPCCCSYPLRSSYLLTTLSMASSQSNPPHPNSVPSSSTFSFKNPFPVPAVPPSSLTSLKQRRVSLASPSSPRVVQPWCFRDEMGLDSQSTEAASSALADEKGSSTTEKKGKMRKVDPTADGTLPAPEKKPRKKWTHEETMMLVNGCQIVRPLSSSFQCFY